MLFERKPYPREPILATGNGGSTGDGFASQISDLLGTELTGALAACDAKAAAGKRKQHLCNFYIGVAHAAYCEIVEAGTRLAWRKWRNGECTKTQRERFIFIAKRDARERFDAAAAIAEARYGWSMVSTAKRDVGMRL